MNSLRNPDFLYEGQRLRIAGEAGGGRRRPKPKSKVAAIDAARGEAQREGAAVEVVREETTRPIGTGEPTRGRRAFGGCSCDGGGDDDRGRDRGGAGGRESRASPCRRARRKS